MYGITSISNGGSEKAREQGEAAQRFLGNKRKPL